MSYHISSNSRMKSLTRSPHIAAHRASSPHPGDTMAVVLQRHIPAGCLPNESSCCLSSWVKSTTMSLKDTGPCDGTVVGTG